MMVFPVVYLPQYYIFKFHFPCPIPFIRCKVHVHINLIENRRFKLLGSIPAICRLFYSIPFPIPRADFSVPNPLCAKSSRL